MRIVSLVARGLLAALSISTLAAAAERPAPAAQTPLPIGIELIWKQRPARIPDVKIVAISLSNETERRQFVVSPRDSLTVRLRRGFWSIGAEAEGLWAPEEIVTVGETERVTLTLWRTAPVSGRVQAPEGTAPPDTVWIGFQAVGGESARVKGSIKCPVRDAAWRCELPAAVLDLQLHSLGYITRYDWDLELRPNEVRDLGTFRLERGASVVGWVEDEAGRPPAAGAVVELTRDEPVLPEKAPAPKLSVPLNHRGFFQVTKMELGDYLVQS